MQESIIQVKHISKKYNIRHESQYLTLRDEIVNSVKKPLNLLLHKKIKDYSKEDLWALKDISFDVKNGEVLGIVGKNGAGKTTLLKILSRITHPTEGEIKLHGRLTSLLEVGTGFHAELTGRENIFFNGAILGMKRKEIQKKFDEIVAFSELEKFLDTPAKRYSSGMYVRLAFAVAAHLESEILLVDEVLAVGDIAFQKKCLGKIDSVAREGRVVLFVTHNIGQALNLCSRGIMLKEGHIAQMGSIENVINYYLAEGVKLCGEVNLPENRKTFSDDFKFTAVRIYGLNEKLTSQVLLSEGFEIEIEYEVFNEIQGVQVEFALWNSKNECIFISSDADSSSFFVDSIRRPGKYISRCKIPNSYLRLNEQYQLDVKSYIPEVRTLDHLEKVISIKVIDDRKMPSKIRPERKGVITPLLDWKIKKI